MKNGAWGIPKHSDGNKTAVKNVLTSQGLTLKKNKQKNIPLPITFFY
jgi:hypothetical protein